MPHDLRKLSPNLIVADVARSMAFYRDVLGFAVEAAVPDEAPHVFAIVRSGPVEILLNAPEPAVAEYPTLKDRPIGGSFTLFVEVSGIRQCYESLKGAVDVVMPLETKWYGMTEFAFLDPDGYVVTFAERT